MRRTALITGAAGGIGQATVAAFVEQGWQVIALDRQPMEDLPELTQFHQVDVSDPHAVEGFFTELSAQIPRLEALVNNAAIQICKPLLAMSVEEWDAVMASNVRSVFLMVRGASPLLRAARGAVVNVSSVHAVATSKDIAAYAASKGALLALTRAMALEFAAEGVRVNAVLPGAVDTHMLRAGLRRGHVEGDSLEVRMAELAKRTVMGRIGEPEEIAQTILFLADGTRSSFMTGQSLIVDGGATARLSTE